MDQINHTPNSCHFKNQQSSIDNHQSKSTASDFFLLSTLSHLQSKQPCVRSAPSSPPPLSPPAKAPVANGCQAIVGEFFISVHKRSRKSGSEKAVRDAHCAQSMTSVTPLLAGNLCRNTILTLELLTSRNVARFH